MPPLRATIALLSLAVAVGAGCTGSDSGGQAGGGASPTSPATGAAGATTTAPPTAPSTTRPATAVWSSGRRVKNRQPQPTPLLVNVRTAHHPTYDRIVFEFRGPLPGYRIEYVPRVVEDASGAPVPLAGQAFLSVVLMPANAHTENGARSFPQPTAVTTGYPSLKQVKLVGDFEAVVSFGLGLDDRVGYRVLELRNPSRIVVDVAA